MAIGNVVERIPTEGVNIGIISPGAHGGERYVVARVYRPVIGDAKFKEQKLPPDVSSIGSWQVKATESGSGRPEVGEGYMGPESRVWTHLHDRYSIRPDRVTYTCVEPTRV